MLASLHADRCWLMLAGCWDGCMRALSPSLHASIVQSISLSFYDPSFTHLCALSQSVCILLPSLACPLPTKPQKLRIVLGQPGGVAAERVYGPVARRKVPYTEINAGLYSARLGQPGGVAAGRTMDAFEPRSALLSAAIQRIQSPDQHPKPACPRQALALAGRRLGRRLPALDPKPQNRVGAAWGRRTMDASEPPSNTPLSL
jgi:hypothetical protein